MQIPKNLCIIKVVYGIFNETVQKGMNVSMKKNAFLISILAAVLSLNSLVAAAPTASPKASPVAEATTKTEKKATASPEAKEDKKASDSTEKKSSKESDTKKTSTDTNKKSDEKKTDKKSEDSEKKSEEEETQKTDPAVFPVPRAKAAVVIDANSGDVIYALNSEEKMFPAGTSNIMTAIIALENTNLADYYEVTEAALEPVTYTQPQLGMKVGESYSVEQLLYAILVNSCNDAANTLAIGVSGSIDAFVQKMNDKAAELGLTGTHFANPSGLHDENHYTTAYDLAKLAQYAMKNSSFMKITSTQKYVFPATAYRKTDKTILSTNHLISRYKYPYHYYANATGVKSGNSTEAGYCLAASAVKGKLNVLSVVMGCENEDVKEGAYSFVDTAKIFDYVFENYQSVLLAKKGDVIHDSKVKEAKDSTRLALTVSEDIYTTLKKTADPDMIQSSVDVTGEMKAPIVQGDYFGTVTYMYNGHELRKADLVAANEVKRDFIIHIINSVLGFIFHPVVLIILAFLIFVWARIRINRNRKRRLRHSKMAYYRNGNPPVRARRDGNRSQTADGDRRTSPRRGPEDSGTSGSSYTRRRR